jgi:hypothetical protein
MTAKILTILSLALTTAGGTFVMQDDGCQQINQPCPVKNAERGSNPPWFPSLMAYEHYDSGRTKLFEQSHFAGSYDGNNQVALRTAPTTYPTVYNMVYLSPDKIFLYGGGYGNIPNATGAFVAKVDPDRLKPIWYKQLINTAETGEWDYPGVAGILKNGLLYVIYGYRLAKLDPRDGTVIKQVDLPAGEALPQNTSYNGFDALPDGTLIAKTIYRSKVAKCRVRMPSLTARIRQTYRPRFWYQLTRRRWKSSIRSPCRQLSAAGPRQPVSGTMIMSTSPPGRRPYAT